MNGDYPQAANRRFLRVARLSAIALLLGVAGLVGFMLPSTMRPYIPVLRWIDGLVTVLFGILSWELFQLAVPVRYFYLKKWRVLRLLSVPLVWIVLVVVFAICLGRIKDLFPDELYTLRF